MTNQEHCPKCGTLLVALDSVEGLCSTCLLESGLGALVDSADLAAASPDSGQASQEDELSLDFLDPCDNPECLGRLGQYVILDVIGRGGMGVVLKAQDTKLNRVVAIKVLAPETASNPTARKRFLREAQAAAAVSHDHVVTIHGVEDAERVPFLVMECIDGQSLQQKIEQDGSLEIKEILRVGMQTASGLAASHKQGLVHRDIKPSNILLENGIERVRITDFGLARAIDDIGITQLGRITGTPEYMSPEQALGQVADHRADLFSLGSVLYTMCTGRSAFRADSSVAVLRRVCDDTPRSIRDVNPDIPRWLEELVERLLEKNPEDRFQSAEEVSEFLEQHLAHLQSPSDTLPPKLLPASERRPASGRKPGTQASGVPSNRRRWVSVALGLLLLCGLLGTTEATGVTQLTATVIRIVTGEGTLVVEVDDPSVLVTIDGEEIRITGSGVKELRLRPGKYKFSASKDGQPVKQELVTIIRGGRQVVSVSIEENTPARRAGGELSSYTSIPPGSISLSRLFEGALQPGDEYCDIVQREFYRLLPVCAHMHSASLGDIDREVNPQG